MKKIIFFFLISISFVSILNSQISIQDWSGANLLNNGTYNLPEGSWTEAYHFNIKNEGSSAISFIVEVTDFLRPDDDNLVLSFCAAGLCNDILFTSTVPMQIGFSQALAAGGIYGEEGNANGEEADIRYMPEGNSNHVYVTFRVYEQGNESNSITITLDNETVGLSDISNSDISIYPNPASNYFKINVTQNLIGTKLILTNLLGKKVLSQKLLSKQELINVANLNKGIYFYSIIKNDKIIETKKLIIK